MVIELRETRFFCPVAPPEVLSHGPDCRQPFFLEESVRAMVETKAPVGERGAYRLARSLDAVQVPATVQAILGARIDRLATPPGRAPSESGRLRHGDGAGERRPPLEVVARRSAWTSIPPDAGPS
jgi:hypothetical protein